MSLSIGYSYCINMTDEEKLAVDKRVRQNRFDLLYTLTRVLEIFSGSQNKVDSYLKISVRTPHQFFLSQDQHLS